MGIIASNKGADFEQTPAGSFIARCYRMHDVGTHASKNGKRHTVWLYFELLAKLVVTETEDGEVTTMEEIRMEDGRPFSVQAQYTLSLYQGSKLRSDLEKWRGLEFTEEEAAAFDITKLLGKYCKVEVKHTKGDNGKVYANLEEIKYTKKKPEGVNDLSWWSVSEPDFDAFDSLPNWIKDKVETSEEWLTRLDAERTHSTVDESEVPKDFLK